MVRRTNKISRSYTRAELSIIAKYAGKIPVGEIVKMVNEVSQVTRTEDGVVNIGNKHGFKFGLEANA